MSQQADLEISVICTLVCNPGIPLISKMSVSLASYLVWGRGGNLKLNDGEFASNVTIFGQYAFRFVPLSLT